MFTKHIMHVSSLLDGAIYQLINQSALIWTESHPKASQCDFYNQRKKTKWVPRASKARQWPGKTRGDPEIEVEEEEERVSCRIIPAAICLFTRFSSVAPRTRTWRGCRTSRSWRWCWRRPRACRSSPGQGASRTALTTTWMRPVSPTEAPLQSPDPGSDRPT